MRLAAVDIGTNTVRLLVADVEDGALVPVTAERAITRLGQGVDEARRLHPDAIGRTLEAITRFSTAARQAGAEQIRVAGTSVLRDAADRDDFARSVAEATGLDLEVIAGAEEGRIAYLGATSELDVGDHVICDIGGGSTELSTTEVAVSLDIGSVRLKERCLHGDPPNAEQVRGATELVDSALDGLEGLETRPGRTFVGVAGTITTVAALVLGLGTYDSRAVHHSRMSAHQVGEISAGLLAMPADQIRALGPVERGREDLVGGGSLILDRVMRRFRYPDVLVSERDILDGLVLDLAQKLA